MIACRRLFVIARICDCLAFWLCMGVLDLNFDIDFDLFRDSLVDVDRLFWKEEIFDGVGAVDCEKIAGCQRISKFEKICT